MFSRLLYIVSICCYKKEQLKLHRSLLGVKEGGGTIIIDDQLKWLEHIQYIKNKVSKSVGFLCKVQKYLDLQTLHNLYYTFVYPYLIYGVEIWGNACSVYLDPLVKLQKKCLRIITFSSYLEPLFKI